MSKGTHIIVDCSVLINSQTNLATITTDQEGKYAWLLQTPLVIKPDQLIKCWGKAGLVGLNLDWAGVQAWITQHMDQSIQIEHAMGELDHFIIKLFMPHDTKMDEYYICIQSDRECNKILFIHEVVLM